MDRLGTLVIGIPVMNYKCTSFKQSQQTLTACAKTNSIHTDEQSLCAAVYGESERHTQRRSSLYAWRRIDWRWHYAAMMLREAIMYRTANACRRSMQGKFFGI